MPSVAIMFNVLPINCKDGFEMIYRIQGDKAILWPCMWERLERKCFYCGSCSSQGVTYRKMGKTSLFLSSQHYLGMERKRDGPVCAGWGCSRDIPGSVLRGRGIPTRVKSLG